MNSVKSENSKTNSGYTVDEQICIFNKQLISTIVLIFTALLQIIILSGSRAILFVPNDNSNKTESTNTNLNQEFNKLKKCIEDRNDYITKFIITTVIIVAFYFFFQSLDDYEVDKTQNNYYSIIANILSVVANIIRFITVFRVETVDDEDVEV